MEWFGNKNAVPEDTDHILNYLKRLDSTMNSFMPAEIRSSEIPPDYVGPSLQMYYNSEGIKHSQLDFFILTTRSEEDRQVYLFSDAYLLQRWNRILISSRTGWTIFPNFRCTDLRSM